MRQQQVEGSSGRRGGVKCLVWDLDHTLWQGILAERDPVAVAPAVRRVIGELDARGILQSIASRNDAGPVLDKLRELELDHYFLHPQINWGPKSASLARIAEALDIGIDTLAFIDDQPYELDEVAQTHASVLCVPAGEAARLLERPEFMPRYITDESRLRRQMYTQNALRQQVEESFDGPKEEFLSSLDMVFTVASADTADLYRLEELTARTNQLNTTGRIYSHAELDAFRCSPAHHLLVASLDDKYGMYGKIGLALVERGDAAWNIKLLLMSCRVLSRGVGTLLLQHIMRQARAEGVALTAEMIPNQRNRMMYATYKFAGFRETGSDGAVTVLAHDLASVAQVPSHVTFHARWPRDARP